ncbi:lipocalin family protein [Hymenobacter lapidiphilus]|uniref:Lipocalin family protein n=1 Tax=Hymenobacter lapidiphilus TaxID=2608003 RepID=A0A7Y7PN75_9BACT|nr:lipocalin family protein [Hymenobacter lapidiphilus]NVO30889.1 lipocalin family protein [Hymenobacter lapidiphilus]
MKRITCFLLALTAGSVFVGCSNDKKSEDPMPQSKSELLMAKTWTITAETETVGTTTKSVFEKYDACELDNTTQFLAGNSMSYDQGAIQCDPDEPRTITGSWALSENDTKLALVVYGFGTQGKIEELTENRMVLSETATVNNRKVETTITFSGK